MLKNAAWYNYLDALETALLQAQEEGKDVSGIEEEVKAVKITESYTYEQDQIVGKWLDRIDALPVMEGYAYDEPSDLEGIHRLQSPEMIVKRTCASAGLCDGLGTPEKEKLYDKMYGAWIGRVAGCDLGKPVENWTMENIRTIAEAGNNYPMTDYIEDRVELGENFPVSEEARERAWFKRKLTGFAPEDDDTNYTALALKLVEIYGRDFTSLDMAEMWLSHLPVLHVCTAELAGYRNILNHILPPASGAYRNPYKEWIGAQIRGDYFGYINPGNPIAAADMAYRDACMTHIKNGIYGEMMIAGMIAQAAVTMDMDEVINAGLAVIPHTSRLYEEITNVVAWARDGVDYWEAVERVRTKYPQQYRHYAVHTISNAMLVVIALLYGEKDFTKTISYAVVPGYDTDCNGATAGSIIGIMLGARQIDKKWYECFDDTLLTGISEYNKVKITEMAEKTVGHIVM